MKVTCDFRVTDLKQHAYCPRIPFYQHVMGFQGKPTFKMEQGKIAQTAFEALEKRRRFSEYGLAEGRAISASRSFRGRSVSPANSIS